MKHALLITVWLAVTSTAHAAGFGLPPPPNAMPDRFSAPDGEPQTSHRSAQEAAREAQKINGGGRVLSVDSANGGWRVKLLKDGNVRMVFVPG